MICYQRLLTSNLSIGSDDDQIQAHKWKWVNSSSYDEGILILMTLPVQQPYLLPHQDHLFLLLKPLQSNPVT